MIPVSVFNTDLAPLESLVFYLREIGHSFKTISELTNRSSKTIWTTYTNALKKDVELDSGNSLTVPLFTLNNRCCSILENLCVYLKDNVGMSFAEISRTLNKNKNTVWTAYNRAMKKNE